MAYLKQSTPKATGRTHLSMAEGYYDKERGHTRTKSLEPFGYLDELEKTYEDPIAHFQQVVDEYNREAEQEDAEYTIIAKKNQKLEKNTSNRKNFGYIVIMKLYYELGLDQFLLNRQRRKTKIEFNTSSIMKLLIISRILAPGSKKRAFDRKSRYFDFEKEDAFGLADVYRALSFYAAIDTDIQVQIHNRITKRHGRNLDFIYYDVTNYYFEIDKDDGLRVKGVSKENRKSPIVQMGLAMDADGLPVSYEVFAGNESEKLHLRPMVLELHNRYECGRVIVVADSAQNTGNNVYYLDEGKQWYVFSQSIRGGSDDFKKYVTGEDGYVWYGDEYKRKSTVNRRKIKVDFDRKDGTTHKKTVWIDQRQIVFYSEKYAVRSRTKREAALKKAGRIINDPSAYTRATSYGALKYVMNVGVDDETGELKAAKGTPCYNLDQIREDEKYDGYYALVTNLFNDGEGKHNFSDGEIIDIYRGLWRIEDTFKVSKEEIATRPVFLSREDHIRAHFLTCYISLVIIRLIQKYTNNEYSPEELVEAMNSISCSGESENLFLFDYRSDVSDALGDAFGIDFTQMRHTRQAIKKLLGDAKKD